MINGTAPERVQGVSLVLRLIMPEDADYIHNLRTDGRYNTHLSPVTGSADDQRDWIMEYKRREAAGQEYYYVIERRDDARVCGTVRLYDIRDDCFTWGSWILDEQKPAKAALESAVLSFSIGFDCLSTDKALIDVRRLNTHATSFYRRFNAIEIRHDDTNIYFELTREQFFADRASYQRTIGAYQ